MQRRWVETFLDAKNNLILTMIYPINNILLFCIKDRRKKKKKKNSRIVWRVYIFTAADGILKAFLIRTNKLFLALKAWKIWEIQGHLIQIRTPLNISNKNVEFNSLLVADVAI